MTSVQDQQQTGLGDKLYEQYAQPLEADRWGEFIAIARDGRTIVGADMLEVARRAITTLGRGAYLFKIGERAIGRWR